MEIPPSLPKHLSFLWDRVAMVQEREHLFNKCAAPVLPRFLALGQLQAAILVVGKGPALWHSTPFPCPVPVPACPFGVHAVDAGGNAG